MSKSNWTLAATAALSLLSASAAEAKTVSFSGCVYRGVESSCLMVRSGGTVYNISAARPRPGVGRAIAGTGSIFTGPTICLQGTTLTRISWHYTKVLCPLERHGKR
jgi:hypothetical protein